MEHKLREGIIFIHTYMYMKRNWNISWILCGRLNVGNDGVC
jgi:hypothetical protein